MDMIDYSEKTKRVIGAITTIGKFAKEFSKYEMIDPVREEIEDILNLSSQKNISEILKIEDPKECYAELIDNLIQIEDDVFEIELLTSDLMKHTVELSNEERKNFFGELGIDPIEKENMGISPERRTLLDQMIALTTDLAKESEELYSEELEDYIDAI